MTLRPTGCSTRDAGTARIAAEKGALGGSSSRQTNCQPDVRAVVSSASSSPQEPTGSPTHRRGVPHQSGNQIRVMAQGCASSTLSAAGDEFRAAARSTLANNEESLSTDQKTTEKPTVLARLRTGWCARRR